MTDKEIVQAIQFGSHQPPAPEYSRAESGQQVTPEFMAFIQQALSGRIGQSEGTADLDPQVRALAEELSVIHLPEWSDEVGRKRADPTVTSMKQAVRVADYLVKRGVRVHPELEEVRWMPTPGGLPGAFDTGLHIVKDEAGGWPAPDPDEFYDLEEIQVKQVDNGLWSATHPRGVSVEAATKSEAYAAMVDILRNRIELAKTADERHIYE
ncbi:hypothetical protein ACFWPK_26995 [Nocardia sp. NPDC058519]|uniref:hypothetical protein n=1 Tax=Nocardia sp. NPDC058519 TaxID=3346535 RepID=UPI0036618799